MRLTVSGLTVCLVLLGLSAPVHATDVRLIAEGASDGITDDLSAASLTLTAAKEEGALPQDLLAAARADYARLIGVLYSKGFYGPVISIRVDGREAAAISPYEAPAVIGRIVLNVETGPRFNFGRAEVAPLAPGTELPERFAVGRTARSTVIGDAARAGVDGWRAIGHAKAGIAGQSVVADHNDSTLDVVIRLDPARQLTFGKLLVDGKSRTKPKRIQDIAGLREGEVFSPDELRRVANRLRRSGVFRSVTLTEAETANPDGSLDIEAMLVDEKKRRLGFGAEVSSLEGLAISGYWMHRNLFRGAERLRIEGEVSGIGGDSGGIDYRLGASLTRPATFTPDTSLALSAEAEVLDEPEYYEEKIGVQGGLIHQYTDALEVGAAVALRYAEVDDDLGIRSFTHLSTPLHVTWDRRDDALDPASGFYLNAAGEPFVEVSNGTPGARLTFDGRGYYPLGGNRVVLAGRVQLGSVLGADLDEVPPDMLFFSGGGGTVRGQPYQSLGVDLGGDDTVGGRGFAAVSAEVRVGLSDKIGLVGFADMGVVGDDSFPGSGGDWHSGAGIGLRYNTGIGPIRLDVAAPTGGNTGDGVQFYIGIGQAF